MAITFEEEKKQGFKWVDLIGVAVFALVILSAVYLLFLTRAPEAASGISQSLQSGKALLGINPQSVTAHPLYQSLQPLEKLQKSSLGRPNPFQ